MKKWKGSLLLAICLLAMTSSMTVCAAGETILKGVSIDKLDVSGMTREEALAALESYEKNLGGQSIKLGIGDNVIEAKLSDLGVTFGDWHFAIHNHAIVDSPTILKGRYR